MLLFAADHYLNQKQYDKTIEYAEKLVSVIEAKPKPEGVSDADWEKRKQTLLGRGHWMAGIAYSAQNKHAQTDKSLRAALPYIKDDTQLLAPALFYLGLSNFRLGDAGKGDTNRILEALRFNQQCAAIKSPFQARAQQNITAIKSKYRVQ
jgi:tetratricopeptide (TPR) repeat protein